MPPHPSRAAFLLAQLGSLAADGFAEELRPLDLTPREAGVLRLLARGGTTSQRELAARLQTAPSRVVALVDGLEARGLVERTRGQDRRRHELGLTDDGRAVLGRLRGVATSHEERLLGPLTPADRDELARLLGVLVEAHALDPDVHRAFGAR